VIGVEIPFLRNLWGACVVPRFESLHNLWVKCCCIPHIFWVNQFFFDELQFFPPVV
jgi:hypothetical protein